MSQSATLKIAASQYPIDFFEDFTAFEKKVKLWVGEAVEHGAGLLMFPEYGSMELCSLLKEEDRSTIHDQIRNMQSILPDALTVYKEQAKQHNIWLLAPSMPVLKDGVFYNIATLFSPDGQAFEQPKLMMTRFEREIWNIQAGSGFQIIDAGFAKIGICICYDSEFPLLAREFVKQGVTLLLVPSCTDTGQGYYRVRTGAQARALEGQIYVAQSPTVGDVSWCEAVDENKGAAGIYAPQDKGFPEDGILAIGEREKAGWIYADLDFDHLRAIRDDGMVFTYADWPLSEKAVRS